MKGFIDRIKQFDVKSVDKRQKIAAAAGISGLFITAGVLVFASESGNSTKSIESPVKIEESKKKIQVSKLAGGVSAQNKWMHQAESTLKGLKEEAEKQSTENTQLQNKLDETQSGTSEKMQKLEEEVQEYKQKLENFISSSSEMFKSGHEGEGGSPSTKSIKTIEIALDGNASFMHQGIQHKLDYYLPTGSVAKAVLTQGVVAQVGMATQSNPIQVSLRVIGKARGAAYKGVVQTTDIEGCKVIGAAKADRSSERVTIELVKMTCSRGENTVIETEVKGFVSSQGVTGILGKKIQREDELATKAMLAGVIGGLGSGISQAYTPTSSLFSSGSNTPNIKDIAGQGFGKGIGSSSDRLANYYIQQLEQIGPVLSVPGGIMVDIEFQDGTYIDGRKAALQVQNNGQ